MRRPEKNKRVRRKQKRLKKDGKVWRKREKTLEGWRRPQKPEEARKEKTLHCGSAVERRRRPEKDGKAGGQRRPEEDE